MTHIYAMPGEGLQQFGGECPPGWVQMEGERQAPGQVASAEGTWIEAALPVPASVSRYQGRQALRLSTIEADFIVINDTFETSPAKRDLLAVVEELLDQAETPAYYRDAWAELQQFERDSPMLLAIADELGLGAVQLDDLFRFAATLKA